MLTPIYLIFKVFEGNEMESFIMGYHHYKTVWTPIIGQQLDCDIETGNPYDQYAIRIIHGSDLTVGHAPRELSRYFSGLINAGRKIKVEVTGNRENRRNRGLEIPARYILI